LIYGKTGKQVQEVLHTNIFEVIDEAPREIVTKFSYGKSFSWMVIGIPWLFFAVVRDLVQFWKIAYFETPVTADLGITTVVDQNFLRNFQKTLKFIQSEKVSCEEFYRIFQQFDEVTDPDINHEREEEIMKILKQFSSPVFDYNIEVLKIRKIFPKKVVGLYEMKDLENFSQFNLPWICKGLTSFQKKNGTIVKLKKMKMKNQNYHLKFDQEIEKVENAVKVHRKKIREALRDCRVIFRRFNKEIT
jgi:transcriptional regulator of met regulon